MSDPVSQALLDANPAKLDAMLDHWARVAPNAQAVADPLNREDFGGGMARSFTFAEANALVDRLAQGFRDHGLRRGDKIAIQLPNVWESPLTVIAAWRAGLVPCIFPLLWRKQEIDAALATVAPRAIVTTGQFAGVSYAEIMRDAAVQQMSVRYILGIDFNTPDGVTPLTDWLLNEAEPAADRKDIAEDSDPLAGAVTWSASPLKGKAMLHSASGLAQCGHALASQLHLSGQDILLNPYPMSTLTGLAGFLLPWLLSGARMVLHQPFDFDGFARQLSDENVTYTAVPAPVIDALVRSDQIATAGHHLARLGCVWPLGLAMQPGIELSEPALPIYDIHNLEEHALIARSRQSGEKANDLPLGKIGSCGPDGQDACLETRVRGSVGHDASEANQLQGELLVRGPTIARPLVEAPGSDGAEQKFLATGIGCIVEEANGGFFNFRLGEDDIHHGGVTISARELDQLYAEFPDFLDVAAFAIDDPVMGHRVIAAVVPRPEASPSLNAFKEFLSEKQVAPYKLPDQLVITQTIPRRPDGEVERAQILSGL
jgi:acyl-CoA synthetase (AMP-forming)/AMP-acid ligase II